MTYDDIESLWNGLNLFKTQINNNQIDCIMAPILRIKNGFTNVLNWNSFNDAQYCDIKFNLLFTNNNEMNELRQSQIVEIQFLLKFLLKAKKMGHKYYGIKRTPCSIRV